MNQLQNNVIYSPSISEEAQTPTQDTEKRENSEYSLK
jgi:hypothetical protein